MATRKLKRLDINQDYIAKLSRSNITTCQEFLSLNHLELLKILQTSDSNIQMLIKTVSLACVPELQNAVTLQTRATPNYLRLSLPNLDYILKGGIPAGSVTEIAGPPGCGKTQFCLMLSIQATLATLIGGLNGSVIYIDTESAFSATRVIQIAQMRHPELFHDNKSVHDLNTKIFLYKASNCAGVTEILDKLEMEIISKGVKLVIVDSIASLVRKEFDMSIAAGRFERTNMLTKQASVLKYLAESFHIPVLVTNQITTRFGPLTAGQPTPSEDLVDTGTASIDGDQGYVTAALGNTWSHCVNTRLLLQFLDHKRRELMIIKSPVAPFANFIYTIEASGIVLADDIGFQFQGTDPGLQKIRTSNAFRHDLKL